jgi:hypothetical protein
MGKNWVTPAMTARPQEPAFQVIYVATVTIGRPDFYRQRSFGLAPHGTIAVGFEAVRREARTCQADHRLHPVLVIDEAHLMPDATLSHLHVLANFDMDSRPLLSLVSVGLPELQDRLRLGVHRSLLTRIGTMVDIGPATPDDTAACVRHRLEGAGSTRERFASDGILMLDELAAGVPAGAGRGGGGRDDRRRGAGGAPDRPRDRAACLAVDAVLVKPRFLRCLGPGPAGGQRQNPASRRGRRGLGPRPPTHVQG